MLAIAFLCLLALQLHSSAQTPATTAFGQSLAFRTDRIVADQTLPSMDWLAQTNPVSDTSQGPLHLKLTLETSDAAPRLVKSLGETLVLGGNLAALPFPISIDAQGVPDGYFRCIHTAKATAISTRFSQAFDNACGLTPISDRSRNTINKTASIMATTE